MKEGKLVHGQLREPGGGFYLPSLCVKLTASPPRPFQASPCHVLFCNKNRSGKDMEPFFFLNKASLFQIFEM